MIKATGIVRRVDELGRVVLPVELRRTLEIDEKDSMEIFVEGSRIILQKYAPACLFCGDAGRLVQFRGKNVCHACLSQMKPEAS